MTPTQFKEAVEAAAKDIAEVGYHFDCDDSCMEKLVNLLALAAIQTATAELLEGLKAEHNAICGTLRADNPRDDCKYPELVDQIIVELRQIAKELKQ